MDSTLPVLCSENAGLIGAQKIQVLPVLGTMRRLCSGDAACDNRRLSPMIKMYEVTNGSYRLIIMAMKTKEV